MRRGRVVGWALSLLRAWMAVVYHWTFFRPVNPAAGAFAVVFLLLPVIPLLWAW